MSSALCDTCSVILIHVLCKKTNTRTCINHRPNIHQTIDHVSNHEPNIHRHHIEHPSNASNTHQTMGSVSLSVCVLKNTKIYNTPQNIITNTYKVMVMDIVIEHASRIAEFISCLMHVRPGVIRTTTRTRTTIM